MTLAARIALIAALILSIIIPFGYYLIGEKNKGRYKRAIGVNVFFFFGAFVLASTISRLLWLPVYPVSAAVSPWQVQRARHLARSARTPASLVSR